ncbi:MAG: hypothetical protein AB7S38_40650 [Vulcanimicrobiota bacterium]
MNTLVIEVEQTHHYLRERSYLLGEKPALYWGKRMSSRDEPVCAWPDQQLTLEREVSWPAASHDGGAVELELHRFYPERGFLGPDIPDARRIYSLLEGTTAKRVRLEFTQTAYRRVYRLTVLERSQQAVARPEPPCEAGATIVSVPALRVATPTKGLLEADRELRVNGMHLGMAAETIYKLPSDTDNGPKIGFRYDTYQVISLDGSRLEAGETLLESGASRSWVAEVMTTLAFDYMPGQRHDYFWNGRVGLVAFHSDERVESFLLVGGGGSTCQRCMTPVGEGPTVNGLKVGMSRGDVYASLGQPEQPTEDRVCWGRVRVDFRGDRCVQVVGDQLEQHGHLLLEASPGPLSAQHSAEQVKVALSVMQDRRTTLDRPGAPSVVLHCTDLDLSIGVYADGRREFVLREVDLPQLCVDLDYPEF